MPPRKKKVGLSITELANLSSAAPPNIMSTSVPATNFFSQQLPRRQPTTNTQAARPTASTQLVADAAAESGVVGRTDNATTDHSTYSDDDNNNTTAAINTISTTLSNHLVAPAAGEVGGVGDDDFESVAGEEPAENDGWNEIPIRSRSTSPSHTPQPHSSPAVQRSPAVILSNRFGPLSPEPDEDPVPPASPPGQTALAVDLDDDDDDDSDSGESFEIISHPYNTRSGRSTPRNQTRVRHQQPNPEDDDDTWEEIFSRVVPQTNEETESQREEEADEMEVDEEEEADDDDDDDDLVIIPNPREESIGLPSPLSFPSPGSPHKRMGTVVLGPQLQDPQIAVASTSNVKLTPARHSASNTFSSSLNLGIGVSSPLGPSTPVNHSHYNTPVSPSVATASPGRRSTGSSPMRDYLRNVRPRGSRRGVDPTLDELTACMWGNPSESLKSKIKRWEKEDNDVSDPNLDRWERKLSKYFGAPSFLGAGTLIYDPVIIGKARKTWRSNRYNHYYPAQIYKINGQVQFYQPGAPYIFFRCRKYVIFLALSLSILFYILYMSYAVGTPSDVGGKPEAPLH